MRPGHVAERDFQAWVLDVARTYGWRAWHVPLPAVYAGKGRGFRPTRAGAGLPDLILLHDHPPRLILAEVKGTDGKLRPEQREFLHLAHGVGDVACDARDPDVALVGVYSWRPGQEAAIEDALRP